VDAVAERLRGVFSLNCERRRLAELVVLLRLHRPNVLVIGPATEADQTLDLMRAYLGLPIAAWLPRETPVPPTTPFRTLVIRDVDALDAGQQAYLSALLDKANARTQAISTSGMPLFPLVRRGLFLDRLYYQLNAVYLDLNDDINAATRKHRQEAR